MTTQTKSQQIDKLKTNIHRLEFSVVTLVLLLLAGVWYVDKEYDYQAETLSAAKVSMAKAELAIKLAEEQRKSMTAKYYEQVDLVEELRASMQERTPINTAVKTEIDDTAVTTIADKDKDGNIRLVITVKGSPTKMNKWVPVEIKDSTLLNDLSIVMDSLSEKMIGAKDSTVAFFGKLWQ